MAPFSITFGIYGIMFHTSFFNNISEAKSKAIVYKLKIEEILYHIEILENERGKDWREKYNFMLENLTD